MAEAGFAWSAAATQLIPGGLGAPGFGRFTGSTPVRLPVGGTALGGMDLAAPLEGGSRLDRLPDHRVLARFLDEPGEFFAPLDELAILPVAARPARRTDYIASTTHIAIGCPNAGVFRAAAAGGSGAW